MYNKPDATGEKRDFIGSNFVVCIFQVLTCSLQQYHHFANMPLTTHSELVMSRSADIRPVPIFLLCGLHLTSQNCQPLLQVKHLHWKQTMIQFNSCLLMCCIHTQIRKGQSTGKMYYDDDDDNSSKNYPCNHCYGGTHRH